MSAPQRNGSSEDTPRVPSKVSFPELDARWISHWESNGIFKKSVDQRQGAEPFVFYEGPPTANGMPHAGHVLTRVMKDVFLRYRSMCGYHVPRRAGWDTHGLPVEVEVEKDLGIHGRQAIEEYGVQEFTRQCIDSVFRYIDEWRRMTARIGFWIDMDDAYVTFQQKYVESVWWALKTLFDQGLLYQGHKVIWWWPQGGTALSAGEVGQGYKTVDDPSVMVRFVSTGDPNTAFLAWTTTPWTLPSNVALAVKAKATYVKVKALKEDGSTEHLWLARDRMAATFGDTEVEVVEEKLGAELVGEAYAPPLPYAVPSEGPAYQIIAADFVTMDSGSGLVHIAPAFGEDDYRACKDAGLGFLQLVKPDGTFTDEVTDFAGRFCKEADRDILRLLKKKGLLFQEKVYRHDYPYCWRAMDDPLIQYARKSWFVRTTEKIDQVIANNQKVNWEPEHIRDGRFGSFLDNNVDWALSRERFWGTPLPIWVNDETGAMEAVHSTEEILRRNPNAFDAFERARKDDPTLPEDLRVHRPWIDEVTWAKPGEPGVYRRVPEVIDCWFDSGCMPFAQQGYPHVKSELDPVDYPADFITEAVDQTRGWFYSLMTTSTLLFPEKETPRPFRNCVVLGFITAKDGQKLSKHKKNYTDPMEVIESHGADAVRWALYAAAVPGQNTRFSEDNARDALREFILKIWNVHSFFATYADIDGWSPGKLAPAVTGRPDLDRWILAELHQTIAQVREGLDHYRTHVAVRALKQFVDALSNWYVRRSRDRFWAPVDADLETQHTKASAFATLHEVLVSLSQLIAPFVPVLAEELHQFHTRDSSGANPLESVHLADFPEVNASLSDGELTAEMAATQRLVTLGKRVRTDTKIKVRQPLFRALVAVTDDAAVQALARFDKEIREELNVHRLERVEHLDEYVTFQVLPDYRKLGPKLGKQMNACRKALDAADAASLYAQLQSGKSVKIALPEGSLELTSDDVEVRLTPRDGYQAASDRGMVVVLETHLTDELKREGLARELINRIQRIRKDMDLDYAARIQITLHTDSPELHTAIEEHKTHIATETLATDVVLSDTAVGGQELDLDGHRLIACVGNAFTTGAGP